jgi:Ras-related protein Rab-5C
MGNGNCNKCKCNCENGDQNIKSDNSADKNLEIIKNDSYESFESVINKDNPEGNNDDRFTKVENDVYLIEGYDEGKQEENKEPEVADTPLNNKNQPKKSDTKKEVKKFKIILLGEKGVGKSSIIDRYVSNKFSNFDNPGMRDTVRNKKYEVDKNLTAELAIHDTTEVENLGKFPRDYFNDAHGAIIVFNLTDPQSFEKLTYWKEELDYNAPFDVVICYLGNQADRTADRKVTLEEIKNFTGDNLYYDVSAKTGNNVSLAFEQLAYSIIEKQIEEENNPEKVLRGMEGRKTTDLMSFHPKKNKTKNLCC